MRDIRVGVFVCHCGTNIGGVLDVVSIADYARTLPNVVFINGDNNFHSINGDETFELYDDNGIIVDGQTGQPMIAYHTIQRLHTTYDPTQLDTWSVNSDSFATPGSGAVGDGTAGLIINEYSDASGTGNWRYEYVELYYDALST